MINRTFVLSHYRFMSLSQREIQHFLLRTGFGQSPLEVKNLMGSSRASLVESAFSQAKSSAPLNVIPNPLANGREASNLKVLRMILKSKKETERLNKAWIKRMAESDSPLLEKMTFFWHDHFATSMSLAYLIQVQHNTIRKHALGNFRQMLHAMAKDPAMLLFLNGQQNRKGHPNENFAREVMELFTLGIGNYSEKDVQEAARAFTGWHVNRSGAFAFNEKDHDDGQKTVLGRTGRFRGEEILEMLLESRTTARYICSKIYRFLVNNTESESFVNEMTDVFIRSGLDISAVVKHVLLSNEFYREENIGCRIASPVELLVRYLRVFRLKFKNDNQLLALQRSLSQVLFYPPNVSGWGSQRDWVDGTSLLLRMRLPLLLLAEGEQLPSAKSDPDMEEAEMVEETENRGAWIKPESDWTGLESVLQGIPSVRWPEIIVSYLIQRDIAKNDLDLLTDQSGKESGPALMRALTMNTLTLPEFQLI